MSDLSIIANLSMPISIIALFSTAILAISQLSPEWPPRGSENVKNSKLRDFVECPRITWKVRTDSTENFVHVPGGSSNAPQRPIEFYRSLYQSRGVFPDPPALGRTGRKPVIGQKRVIIKIIVFIELALQHRNIFASEKEPRAAATHATWCCPHGFINQLAIGFQVMPWRYYFMANTKDVITDVILGNSYCIVKHSDLAPISRCVIWTQLMRTLHLTSLFNCCAEWLSLPLVIHQWRILIIFRRGWMESAVVEGASVW